MSERFARKVKRLTLDWSVEAQSVIDARQRQVAKRLRRLRRHDAEMAGRLEAAHEAARIDGSGAPDRSTRWFALIVEAERSANDDLAAAVAELRAAAPAHTEELVYAVERGVDRIAALDPPRELANEHAAIVAAQRGFLAALRRHGEVSAGDSVAAVAEAAERVDRARAAIEAAFARLDEATAARVSGR